MRFALSSARGKLKADLSYVDQVNRVFGPDSPVGRWHGDVVLANVSQVLPVGTLTFFDYFIDLDDAITQSSNTLGARLTGSKKLGTIGGHVHLVVRAPSGRRQKPRELHGRLLPARRRAQFHEDRVGPRLRGSRQQRHGLVPDAARDAARVPGLGGQIPRDAGRRYGGHAICKLSYPMGKRGAFTNISAVAFFHDYTAEQGRAHFGSELNLQLIARTEKMVLTLKYADYRADAAAHRHRQALVVGGLRVLASWRWRIRRLKGSEQMVDARKAQARARRQRHGRHARRRGAADARAGHVRHHGVRQRSRTATTTASCCRRCSRRRRPSTTSCSTRASGTPRTGITLHRRRRGRAHRPRAPARDREERASKCLTTE